MPRGRGGLFTNLMFSSESDSPSPGKPKLFDEARALLGQCEGVEWMMASLL